MNCPVVTCLCCHKIVALLVTKLCSNCGSAISAQGRRASV